MDRALEIISILRTYFIFWTEKNGLHISGPLYKHLDHFSLRWQFQFWQLKPYHMPIIRHVCLDSITFFSGNKIIFIQDRFFIHVFHSKPYLHQRPPRRLWYQNMWNFLAHLFIYVKSFSHDAPLFKRPRKSLKLNFRFTVPMKSVRVRYYLKWFLKLYNLS